MSTISRRAFLKTVGVGALSVAAVSVLAGCDTVPGTTGTTTAKTVAGKAGTTYRISDLVSVVTTGDQAATLDDAVGTTGSLWADVYKKAYVEAAGGTINSTKYSSLTSEQKAKYEDAAEKAVAKMDNETATIKFNVANYSTAPIFVASASDASNTSGCVFTATCNGAAVKCTVSPIVVVDTNNNTEVTCSIELPANAETFDVVVTAPNATTVVKYTFKNTNYQDPEKIDPSKFGWQAE